MRAAALFALLLPLAGPVGCDLITGSDDENDGSIHGTWVLQEDAGASYLEITSTTITVYDEEAGGCFTVRENEIVSRDGDRFTLSPVGSDLYFTYTIRREDDSLVIGFEDRTITYQPSDQDVAQLDVCTGGGDDPSIDCAALPAVSIGQTISGELTTGDPIVDSRYFDLYGLTLTAATAVRIDATSDVIDTRLFLYEADGTPITADDDGGTGTNSRVEADLQAGCHRIEVTSYFAEETGAYTLQVN